MASVINQIQSNGINYALAHSAFGVCDTPSDNPKKSVTLCTDGDTTNQDFKLVEGVSVIIKFNHSGYDSKLSDTLSAMFLNINNTGNKPIYYSGIPLLCASDFNSIKAHHSYQFVYRNSADEERWELVGDGFLESEHLCIEYYENSGEINYTYDEILQYVSIQGAYIDFNSDSLGQAMSVVSKLHVIMDNGLVMQLMGLDSEDGNIIFGCQVGNYHILLTIYPDNTTHMEIISMQLEINTDNKLSYNCIDMPYSVTTSTSGSNEIITFA